MKPATHSWSFTAPHTLLDMTRTGYSDKPLFEKLGIKTPSRTHFINIPSNYFSWLELPEETLQKVTLNQNPDFIHLFVTSIHELKEQLPNLKHHLDPAGMLWISWPKKTSGIPHDLNENDIRECALQNGLVDVKVCSVSKEWSGLKLVFPLKDRPQK